MKKLLLVALLMLALVITAVACNNEPADTTGETTATQTPATAEPDDSTAAPETPTEAPTAAPEVPTEAPEVPTEAPTDAPETTEPETSEPKPTEPTVTLNKTEYAYGESIMISASGADKDWVGITVAGGDSSIRWWYVADVGEGVAIDALNDSRIQAGSGDATGVLPAGEYEVVWVANDQSIGAADKVYRYKFTIKDASAPISLFEAADIQTITGGDPSNLTQDCVSLEGDYLHIVPIGPDPYWNPFANVDGARYVAIRYRTDATGADIQMYIGSTGTGPTDDSTMLRQPVVADSEWHLAVFDTQSLIDAGKYDGEYVSYFRFDPLEAGYLLNEEGEPYKKEDGTWARYSLPEGCYIDVEYIAFFHSPEAAEKYDADTHFVVPPHDDLTLVLGVRDGGTPFSGAPAKKFGQRGQIGENFLKNVTIVDLATYADNNTNTWSFKVWQWDTDYATTVAGEPLFVKEGENAPDNTTFSMDIPAELGIRGDIYYEIEYLSGTGTFTGWTAKDVVPGLETYVAGELKAGGYAASITVGVAKPASYDNLTIDILSTDNKGSGANVVPSWPEAGWNDTPVIQMMNWGSYVSLGEIDLSKYSAVVITYGSDASAVQGDVGTFLALTKNGAAENNDSSDKADAEIIAQGTLANAGGGWTTTREVTIAIDSDYVGEVFLAQDMKDNNGIAITSIVFIGAEIPAEPETPVVELTPFEGNFHANVDFINGGSKDGAGVPYQGLGTSMINGTNGVLVVRNAAEDNIVVNADNTINIQGWMAVQGGINHYAYSVNGGELITAVGGADGEPLADYYVGLGMADSTKMGLFNGGNMLIADLSAYAGQTVTVTFYAVPEAAQDTVAPIVSVEGLVVPEAADESTSITVDGDFADWADKVVTDIPVSDFIAWTGTAPESFNLKTSFTSDGEYLYVYLNPGENSGVTMYQICLITDNTVASDAAQAWYNVTFADGAAAIAGVSGACKGEPKVFMTGTEVEAAIPIAAIYGEGFALPAETRILLVAQINGGTHMGTFHDGKNPNDDSWADRTGDGCPLTLNADGTYTIDLPGENEPEAPVVENVVIDPRNLPAGSITGHMTHIVTEADTNHYPMIAAAGLTSGAMIHQGSIYLGEFDLTKYEKVIIYFASDWGQGTQDALAAAKEQGFGYLGLSAIDCNNVVNPNREYFIGEQYTPAGGWTITAHELPNVAASNYSGPVYVSADILEGQFIIIDRIEFIAK